MEEDIFLKKNGEIGTIVLNRPEKKNILTHEMWKSIPGLVQQVEEDSNLKVLIIRGADSTSFTAGADIIEFKTLRADAKGAKNYNAVTHEAEQVLTQMTKPSIAMIQSYCIGGGIEIAAACDFRFSDPHGRFGITPANLGLVYSLNAAKKIVDLVGPSKAKHILFSGKYLDAHEAYRIGLVDQIFEEGEIEEKTYEFASLLCQKSQQSIRTMKYIIHLIINGQTEDNEETIELRNHAFKTEDYQEGVRAFTEKRKPKFN